MVKKLTDNLLKLSIEGKMLGKGATDRTGMISDIMGTIIRTMVNYSNVQKIEQIGNSVGP